MRNSSNFLIFLRDNRNFREKSTEKNVRQTVLLTIFLTQNTYTNYFILGHVTNYSAESIGKIVSFFSRRAIAGKIIPNRIKTIGVTMLEANWNNQP